MHCYRVGIFFFILIFGIQEQCAHHTKGHKNNAKKITFLSKSLSNSSSHTKSTPSHNGIIYQDVRSAARAAVTYEPNGGRFGNNILTYFHAKWISYHYDIPLLYVPFAYSDQLAMHNIETPYRGTEAFSNVVVFTRESDLVIDRNSSTLYMIRYFPENLLEIEHPKRTIFYFDTPWDDEGFKKEIRRCVALRDNNISVSAADNTITVAVHVRRTSNGIDGILSFDFPEGTNTPGYHFADSSFPCLLFVPDTYYIESIKYIATMFPDHLIHVYILSDDKNIVQIMEKYKAHVNAPHVHFFCRTTSNTHEINVLEDFFTITQCDCLIRSESTYAVAASKLGDYLVHIAPVHFKYQQGHLIVDESKIIIRKNPINKHASWVWPHHGSWCRCMNL